MDGGLGGPTGPGVTGPLGMTARRGRRRGRLFGDGARYGGPIGTALLGLVLVVVVALFVIASCT